MSFSARVTFSANKIAATSTTNTAGKSGTTDKTAGKFIFPQKIRTNRDVKLK